MFTVIIVICLLKRMCIPSFILIGCCVRDLRGHLCPYRNVLPEVVSCCFTRTTLFTFPIPWSLWISICTQSLISQLPLVIEIHLSKLKKKKNNNKKEKMKNCENQLSCSPISVIFLGPHILTVATLS